MDCLKGNIRTANHLRDRVKHSWASPSTEIPSGIEPCKVLVINRLVWRIKVIWSGNDLSVKLSTRALTQTSVQINWLQKNDDKKRKIRFSLTVAYSDPLTFDQFIHQYL